MPIYSLPILATEKDVQDYKAKYSKFYERNKYQYLVWYNRLPFMKWISLDISEDNKDKIIGLLCLLHLQGMIYIEFDINATKIRRYPRNDQEIEQWINQDKNRIINI